MAVKLGEIDILKIQKAINADGRTEAVVKVENGRVTVIQVKKTKL